MDYLYERSSYVSKPAIMGLDDEPNLTANWDGMNHEFHDNKGTQTLPMFNQDNLEFDEDEALIMDDVSQPDLAIRKNLFTDMQKDGALDKPVAPMMEQIPESSIFRNPAHTEEEMFTLKKKDD